MDDSLCTMFDNNMLKLQRICLFLDGINFSLTHFDMLQLLIVLCLNFLTKQQSIHKDQGII